MKYYTFVHDLNSKITGSDYPQSWKFTKEYEKRKNNPDAIYALDEIAFVNHQKPNFKPDLDGFVLSGRAKLSNFISVTTMTGLFMDKHAKQVLQSKCNLGEHEFFEATLYVKKEPKEMYYLGLFYDLAPHIKFKECNYVALGLKKEDDLPQGWNNSITCKEDFFKIKKNVPYLIDIYFSHIKIKNTVPKLDIFYFIGGGIYGIVTERFKNIVEEAGLTGLVFKPIDVDIVP